MADGYQWWYLDALSDDGRHGLTIIAFFGSVFSPWYAWARKRGPVDPLEYSCINVALYGEKPRWSMTDRSARSVHRSEHSMQVGRSRLIRDGNSLTYDLDEYCFPLPGRIRGQVRLSWDGLFAERFLLDPAGSHRWQPLAPKARVEVELSNPGICWQGHAYHDSNDGDEPLEAAFAGWNWTRCHTGDTPRIWYELDYPNGNRELLSLVFDGQGCRQEAAPPVCPLKRGFWGMKRHTRGDSAIFVRSMEDAPFYTRSELEISIGDEMAPAVHEALDLGRFTHPVVNAMLPFRVPRKDLAIDQE